MLVGVIAIMASVCLFLLVRLLVRVEEWSVRYALDGFVHGVRMLLAVLALLFVGAGIFLIARPPQARSERVQAAPDASGQERPRKRQLGDGGQPAPHRAPSTPAPGDGPTGR